ncbi:hypothetical protein LTR36_010309 [Oleoguttula mirabilis]|uniref:2-dehydropantoate 2-reductase n=1 Tax=Oleoguttula mirabilis TaxID=1507867 RepID=A0AAV9J516_9PEZI|nr:hypothetical protein LTR36_010309 [Oleoguttula mirabilis]
MEARESSAQGGDEMASRDDAELPDGSQDNSSFETAGLQRSLSAIDRQYAAQPEQPRRIHILGTGSIGKLVAHSLRGIANPPPISLIFHRYRLLEAWEQSKKQITIQDDDFDVSRGGYDVELMSEVRRQHGVELENGQPSVYDFPDEVRPHEAAKLLAQQRKENAALQQQQLESGEQDTQFPPSRDERKRRPGKGDYAISHEPIHNLIVTTKAAYTVPALSAIKHRLGPTSTVCFLQNGMGVIDDVNKHLFPHEADRPNYVQGILTHGVNVPPELAERDPFFAVHAGHGTIALGLLPRSGIKQTTITGQDGAADTHHVQTELWAPSARYLLRTLTRTPVLCAVGFTPTELLQQQLEKLAVNSVLNPLTALLDARNGALLHNFALTRTMRLLLAETSLVIRSLPELAYLPNVPTRFSAARLETLVISVAHKTQDNVSSMLADVRAGRRTEIEYINGYIVRRGEEVGVKCVVNYGIMQTVVGKCMVTQREGQDAVPMVGVAGLNV